MAWIAPYRCPSLLHRRQAAQTVQGLATTNTEIQATAFYFSGGVRMLYEIFDSLRFNARVVHVGEFPNREAAQAHGAKLINEKKPEMVRVRTIADQPRKSFDDLLGDMGIVEKQAIKKFTAKLAAEKRVVSRNFPSIRDVLVQAKTEHLDLVCADDEVSSPKLTAWYITAYCRANSLKA